MGGLCFAMKFKDFSENIIHFQSSLGEWYALFQRQLPWRAAPSVYKTVVSEFMLQQTQVKTVLPYFDRWMQVFPDFSTLAQAEESQVLKYWEGLGYYARARKLHQLAKILSTKDSIPKDPEEWIQFPGIGPYTQAAITSIAFAAPLACVDGNVVRILTRLFADDREYANSTSAAKSLRPLAIELLDRKCPGDHNQAMMELGATICLPRRPLCTICPVVHFCEAARIGNPENFPRLKAKKTKQSSCQRALIYRKDNSLLLEQIDHQSTRLGGIWELPRVEFSKNPIPLTKWAKKVRTIGQERFHEEIYMGLDSEEPAPDGGDFGNCQKEYLLGVGAHQLSWVHPTDFGNYVISGPHKAWIQEWYAFRGYKHFTP